MQLNLPLASCESSLLSERKQVAGGSVAMQQQRLCIKFPYDPYFVEVVKTLSGRQYDADCRVWRALPCVESIATLRDHGFILSSGVQQWLTDHTNGTPVPVHSIPPIKGLGVTLMPFQE